MKAVLIICDDLLELGGVIWMGCMLEESTRNLKA